MRTSSPTKVELMNHPVRLDIILALAGHQLTPKQIAERLPEIAQATLYRHLNLLSEGGVIEVVGQRQVHGVMESTYALKLGGAFLSREEFEGMGPEDHKGCLSLLAGGASKALARYVDQDEFNTTSDGMTYFSAKLNLSDPVSQELKNDLLALANRYSDRQDENGRSRLITISFIPEPAR